MKNKSLLYCISGYASWENGNEAPKVHRKLCARPQRCWSQSTGRSMLSLGWFGFVLVMPHAVLCHTYCYTPKSSLQELSTIYFTSQDIGASTSQFDILETITFWYIFEETSLETSKDRISQWVEKPAKFGCHFNHFNWCKGEAYPLRLLPRPWCAAACEPESPLAQKNHGTIMEPGEHVGMCWLFCLDLSPRSYLMNCLLRHPCFAVSSQARMSVFKRFQRSSAMLTKNQCFELFSSQSNI